MYESFSKSQVYVLIFNSFGLIANIKCLAKLSQVFVIWDLITSVGKLAIDLHKSKIVQDSSFNGLQFDAKKIPYINMYKKFIFKGNFVSWLNYAIFKKIKIV